MPKDMARGKDVRKGPIVELAVDTPNIAMAVETNLVRAKAVAEGVAAGLAYLRDAPLSERDEPSRLKTRVSLIYPADQFGFQRIIGERDILQVTFLRQALNAARSVCRLRIRGDAPAPPSFGTGFLVAPGVLLTNHHVLEMESVAHLSLAEFDAELDVNYVEQSPRIFNLLPDKLFVSDADLDFTFIAVNSVAHDGTPLSDFGFLPLLRESGKGLNGEWATIIQHPGGQTKQIAIRENRIVVLPEPYASNIGPQFLHYKSDTEPGSSGSPVLNDQFEVLALHHKTVPKYNEKGESLARDGGIWTPEMGDAKRDWIANEGTRISSIFQTLDRMAHRSAHAASVLQLLENGEPGSVFSSLAGRRGPVTEEVGEGAELEATALARRAGKGYKTNFLGFQVPLPIPKEELVKLVQPLEPNAKPKGNLKGELVYTHFSVVMHAERRLAIFAAVNINGKLRDAPTVGGSWRIDRRVSRSVQSDNELYRDNVLDKGHLVRKLDPARGNTQQEIDDAVIDTYHYANAAPQEHNFNDGLWGDVEDYILGTAEAGDHKISVFTGPVFGESDIEYGATRRGGPWLIPARFWKVIVYKKSDGTKSATGFLLDQSDEIADLMEGFTPLPKARETARLHQRPVEEIEKLTNLDFGPLRNFDPLDKLEATKRSVRIRLPEQIVL
jgi:endonuclease G, mitochondrial